MNLPWYRLVHGAKHGSRCPLDDANSLQQSASQNEIWTCARFNLVRGDSRLQLQLVVSE